MKQGWEIKKLGEIATYINGYAFKPEHWGEDGLPIIRIQNLNNPNAEFNYCSLDVPDKYVIDNGDILISWSASLGVYEWNQGKAYLNQHIFKVLFNKIDINKFFFKYAIGAKIKDMIKNAHGATMKHIVKGDFDNTPIPVPPLPVQEQIVSELDLLSSITEKKREQLKELDALAQSIFYDMFGDPITNEKGWEVKKLGEVCKVNPSKKDTSIGLSNSDIVSFLPMEDLPIKACYHSPKQTRLFSEVQSSYTCFANNDVLMAKVTPCFENGKIGIASNLMNGIGYGSSEFIVIRANNIDVIKEYPYFVIQNTSFIENACAQLTGTSGLRRVPRQYVENCNISIPPLPLQHQFATKIEAIEKQKELIKQSISETETLFNARMQHYFN